MLITRQSGAKRRNEKVIEESFTGSNGEWRRQAPRRLNSPGTVILLGGVNVLDFRMRVAQSHLRQDLLPSFWSQVGVLTGGDTFLTVPHDERLTPSRVPADNAIHECSLDAYADEKRYPNIALVQFVGQGDLIVENVRRLQRQRGIVDLPQLLIAWLGFAWGAGATGNPLS